MLRKSSAHPGGRSPLALGIAALVPALAVLWFMTVAMRNERLAVQQRLTDVYLNHLTSAQRQLAGFWKEREAAFESAARVRPAEIFAALVRSNLADSVILYEAGGKVAYPASAAVAVAVTSRDEEPAEWRQAQELEFQKGDYRAAADAYAQLARNSTDQNLQARAIQSQAACLRKAGEKQQAIEVLTQLIRDARFQQAVSVSGVAVVPNAQMLLLKLANAPTNETFRATLQDLAQRLNDYSDDLISARQRRFLMEQLLALAPDAAVFPTFTAEKLAADYLESDPPALREAIIEPAGLPRVWRLGASNAALVALFREDRLRAEMDLSLKLLSLPDTKLKLLAPGERFSSPRSLPLLDAGEKLPGWRLALTFSGPDPFAAASARQTRFYLWSGVLVLLIIGLATLAAARYVAAQTRLARLKDDLVSTVTHELKTPLASMRALVDTLLAGRCRDEEHRRTYLELLAKENERLSHLIENFLTFSRLERGKQQFHFAPVKIETLVNEAVTALQDRLRSADCRFETEVAPGLPAIQADPDALTTVLINLLDNAWKYTARAKHIVVQAHQENGAVLLAVRDNGIGLTSREASKVFDRFYQADQGLSRRAGGCGLGLSIVQSIVKAHGGSVTVESEPGQGSTFTVRLPLAGQTPIDRREEA